MENLCQRAVALTDGETFDTDVLALTNAFGPTGIKTELTASPLLSDSSPRNATQYQTAHESLDRELLTRVLTEHRGNVVKAAKALHISRTTLYAKAKKLGVRLPSRRDPNLSA